MSASERVSEALKGSLRMVGNHPKSAKAEGSLTATPTGGAGTKVGLSDPVVLSGNAIAQRIKATLGITGLSPVSYTHLDVYKRQSRYTGKRRTVLYSG